MRSHKPASLSLSLFLCMCIFAVFLHRTYEFVSFVRDKMKQTELGEVIGTLCQDRGEKGEEWERNGYATCLTNDHRFRAPLSGVWWYCKCVCGQRCDIWRVWLIPVVYSWYTGKDSCLDLSWVSPHSKHTFPPVLPHSVHTLVSISSKGSPPPSLCSPCHDDRPSWTSCRLRS